GVAAEPGHAIERVTFSEPVPLRDGFARAAEILADRGRPLTALCACELRSPAPLSDAGFKAFNEGYVTILAKWGIYDAAARRNPAARSNVPPAPAPPAEPALYAFSFTVRASDGLPSFVIAGSGEASEGEGPYGQRTIRRGETSPDALREKAAFVLAEMERRLGIFGGGWRGPPATPGYTRPHIPPFFAGLILPPRAARPGGTAPPLRP